MTKRILIAVVCLLALLPAGAGAEDKLSEMMVAAAEAGKKSVALIVWRVDNGMGEQVMTSLGICVLVDEDGKAVLLAMGMDPMTPVDFYGAFEVTGPGMGEKRLKASLMGVDPLTSVGFVRVEERRDWQPVRFAKKANLSPGTPVVSVGLLSEAMSFAPYVGAGVVSATVHTPETNVSVVGGGLTGFGSPVFGADGQVIGIVGQQFPEHKKMLTQGRQITFGDLGGHWTSWFHPVDEFVFILDEIPASPDQVRPLAWLGALRTEGVPTNLWEINGMTSPGVKLHDVIKGQPAAKAGLADEDIIVAVKGEPLPKFPMVEQTVKHFGRTMAGYGVGAAVEIDVIRGGKPMRTVLTLEAAPKQPGQSLRHISREVGVIIREKVNVDQYIDKTPSGKTPGVLVMRIGENTAAERGGVEVGDTISAINGEKVTTVAAFKELIERALTDEEPVDLAISRSGQDIALSLRISSMSGESPIP